EESTGGVLTVVYFAVNRLGPSLRHCARILGSTGTIATELVKPLAEIDIIATKTPFGQDCGDVSGEHAGAFGGRIDHHARQSRRQRQVPHPAALFGNATIAIDCG